MPDIVKRKAREMEIARTLVPYPKERLPKRMLRGRPAFFVTSLENEEVADGVRAGVVADIPDRDQAAHFILKGTHRISTEEEIQSFFANDQAQVEACAETELARKQQFAMPQDLQTLVAAAAVSLAQGSQPQQAKRKGNEG